MYLNNSAFKFKSQVATLYATLILNRVWFKTFIFPSIISHVKAHLNHILFLISLVFKMVSEYKKSLMSALLFAHFVVISLLSHCFEYITEVEKDILAK